MCQITLLILKTTTYSIFFNANFTDSNLFLICHTGMFKMMKMRITYYFIWKYPLKLSIKFERNLNILDKNIIEDLRKNWWWTFCYLSVPQSGVKI
jgi:hypothetical protein